MLYIRSVAISKRELLEYSQFDSPYFWAHDDQSFAILEILTEIELDQSDRFADAARQLETLQQKTLVHDELGIDISGFLAFLAFSFDSDARAKSKLVVPAKLVGREGNRYFYTEIAREPFDPNPNMPPKPKAIEPGAALNFITEQAELEGFQRSVALSVAAINRGELEKVVLARQATAELPTGFDLRAPIAKLLENYADCAVFSTGDFFGASPEIVMSSKGGQIFSRLLAGSLSKDIASGDELLLASAKDQSEHQLARDQFLAALSELNLAVSASEIYALEGRDIWHLASDISAPVSASQSILELIDAVHPSGAVSGNPSAKARELIYELEPKTRGYYAGVVGWINAKGAADFALGIRSAQIIEGKVVASVGAGLVTGSMPAAEYAETELKLTPIKLAFLASG